MKLEKGAEILVATSLVHYTDIKHGFGWSTDSASRGSHV